MKNRFKQVIQYTKKLLKGRHEKWITRSLIGAGILIIVSAFSQNVWMSFFIEIYNDQFNRNMPNPEDSIKYWYIILSVIVGGPLIGLGLKFHFSTKQHKKLKPMILIQHSSIQTVSYANIDKDFSDFNLESYPINQLDELKTIDSGNIHHALREQEKAVERVSSRIDGSSDIDVAYLGLAHIPMTVLLGYRLSDKLNVSFFEWNQNDLIWEAIESKSSVQYPPLFLDENDTTQDIQTTKEIVIKVGITYPISDEDIQELQLHNLNAYYLHLNPPHRNAILSSEQLKAYKKKFRDLLDRVNQQYPHLQTIHLFYAGQPSLAYNLGSAINSRMDVEIWIYNHVRSENPKYKWGVKLPQRNRATELTINEARD
ncbi:SAVED domain-containing protein [Gorillibacterium timonense]|uniref:SAVED domain-containing protein n=1 Tax=Gorillibacterium timonense TaxID=1689269 RepID=UPI0011DD5D5A|nr:SAVED domain-containing protein [Gorillibacterium timonense]